MVLKQVYKVMQCMIKGKVSARKYDTYLVGYYGMQNSGDDALLLASIKGAKLCLQSRSLLVSAVKELDFSDVDFDVNVLAEQPKYRGQNRLQHYVGAAQSDRVIFGGGSVFHTAQDIQVKRHMMKLTNPSQCMALGVGIGPFNDDAAKKQCIAFLNECGFVGVRDQQSYELAKEIAPNANIKLTFDLAPMLAMWDEAPANQVEKTGVLINVCPVPKDALGNVDMDQHEQMLFKLRRTVRDIWQQSQEPISIISLNGHSEFGDDALCMDLVKSFRGEIPIKFIPYRTDPMEVMQIIRQFKVFVSMRLHGCVFGYLTGTPVMALNYHTKGHQWCEQVGVAQTQRFDANSFNPKRLAHHILQGLETGFSAPTLALNEAVELSLSNWRN